MMNTTTEVIIDFSPFIDSNEVILCSAETGKRLLDKVLKSGINLSQLEYQYEKIVFNFPDRIIVMTKDFLNGLLGELHRSVGSSDISRKYDIKCNTELRSRIKSYINQPYTYA